MKVFGDFAVTDFVTPVKVADGIIDLSSVVGDCINFLCYRL